MFLLSLCIGKSTYIYQDKKKHHMFQEIHNKLSCEKQNI
jgi:hypothetical protein